jgi:UDP-N-acetylmuramoylalanine--D-glutamate ligase
MTETLHPTPQLALFDLAGRQVLVVGLGESGLAMARWCAYKGARVRVADTRATPPGLDALRADVPGVEFVGGALADILFEGVDLLAWSPGLSIEIGDSAAFHARALARGLPVFGEIELFAQALASLREQDYCPKLLAITGTNGKTTTTALTAFLCERAGRRDRAAGNISPAALDALREAIETDDLPEIWVLELSSFQLALAQSLRPDAAAILNVTQDHLDWHASMDSYVAAKQRIYAPGTAIVFNRQDPATRPARTGPAVGAATPAVASFGLDAPSAPGELGVLADGGLAWLAEAVASDDLPVGRKRKEAPAVLVKRLMPADALRIRGGHNQANALAALALARHVGVPFARMLHALREYAGEPHRCELVAVIRDVEYYDDSKGTNVGATVAALDGLGKRCLLIAGGEGKGQDFGPLARPVREHARAVFLIGRDGPRLREALAGTGVPLVDCPTLEDAVHAAAAQAVLGDAVLLSPACASFDMFRNYGHRAEVFVAAVRELAEEAGTAC